MEAIPVHYLDRLLSERVELTAIMSGLGERAAAENRDLSDGERSEVARLQERCLQVDGLLTEHEAQSSSARAFAELQSRIEAGRERGDASPRSTSVPGRQEQRSAGQMVVESTAFQNYPGRGQMAPVEISDFLGFEQRALITTTTLAAGIQPFVWNNTLPTLATPLIDAVSVVRVSSGAVEWVETGPDPVAAVVAEGVAKPEATITMTPKSASLDTIAHWSQITRQALADAGYIRSLIETKLRRGLARKIEADLITLLNAAVLQQVVNADMMKAVRGAIGLVEAAGYRPNAVALNPADYANLDLNAMVESNSGPDRRTNFWGLTPISVPGLTAGVAIVGDFKEGVTLFDRGVSDVFVTDSHSDFFVKNILVILAEGRYKSAITDPLALAETAAA
jgi:HK97 family phage major capsid protein